MMRRAALQRFSSSSALLPSSPAGRDRARRTALRLRLHEPRDAGDAGRRHRQSRHAVGARRRSAVEPGKAGTADRACADCHGDAGASMKGVAARYPAFDAGQRGGRSISSSASISAAPTARRRAPFRRSKARTCWRSPPIVARQSRGMPIEKPQDERLKPFIAAGRRPFFSAARASSTSPARNATTTIGASGWPAASFRRATRPATRSTGWNGRRSARCSAACATA